MTPNSGLPRGGLAYRMSELEKVVKHQDELLVRLIETHAKLEERIGGEGGLVERSHDQTAEILRLRRAAYWVGGVIVAGSVSFAFSVLSLFG